jgi:hypothetical protein
MFLACFFSSFFYLSYGVYQWFYQYDWVEVYYSIGLATIMVMSFISIFSHRIYPVSYFPKQPDSIIIRLGYYVLWPPFITILYYCWPGFWLLVLYGIQALRIAGFVEFIKTETICIITNLNSRFFWAALLIGILISYTSMFSHIQSYYAGEFCG